MANIYALRTTTGREDIAIDLLSTRIRAEALDVKALFHPAEIKGYIFVEGNIASVHKAAQGTMHLRGLIENPIRFDEIQHFLEYKKDRIKVDLNDVVEIIGGPFKGEKGNVKRVDKVKDEVTVELLEAAIPIPVTIATEFVKIIKKAKRDETVPVAVAPVHKEEKTEEKGIFDD